MTPRLHLYTFAWNEAVLVPFFLRHYTWADGWAKIVVYDHHSTDETVALLSADPRVEIRTYGRPGLMSNVDMMHIRNQGWKESRGQADWVYTPDFDEFLWHHDLPAFLNNVTAEVVRPTGFDMLTEHEVKAGLTLFEQCRRGRLNPEYSKPTLFRPDAVWEMRFGPGAHRAEPFSPAGQPLTPYASANAKILHYKGLGLRYYCGRMAALAKRVVVADWYPGVNSRPHYFNAPETHAQTFRTALREAVDVVT